MQLLLWWAFMLVGGMVIAIVIFSVFETTTK